MLDNSIKFITSSNTKSVAIDIKIQFSLIGSLYQGFLTLGITLIQSLVQLLIFEYPLMN